MTKPAANRKALKKRMDHYLWHDEAMPVVKLRELLADNFRQFDQVGIVGGMARDFARAGVRGFRSDVDLVVNTPAKDVEKLALHLGARPNRFGGYAYHHPLWKIDFWALETTWAARHGYASVTELSDIPRCTFFDSDAIVYNLWDRQIISDDEYFIRIQGNLLDINLKPNPSPSGNLLRAVRRLLCWGSMPGDKLKYFIEESLTKNSLESIKLTEARLYANRVIDGFQNPNELKDYLFNAELRLSIDTDFGEQLEFSY